MDGGPGKGDIASFSTSVAGLKGAGVWVSLPPHKALGDGHDRLFRFESIEGSAFHDTLIGDGQPNEILGGPGNDTIIGGGGRDTLNGGQGNDHCQGGPTRISCGPEAPPEGSAYITPRPRPGGRRRPADRRRRGPRQIHRLLRRRRSRSEPTERAPDVDHGTFTVTAAAPLAAGEGCARTAGNPKQVTCPAARPGPLADGRPRAGQRLPHGRRHAGSGRLRPRQRRRRRTTRSKAAPRKTCSQSGPGSDHIYGGDGSDGLIGGLPGPTYLYGEGGGDLLAAGGGCAGGTLDGGPGDDDASFAETQAHPGTLYISLAQRLGLDQRDQAAATRSASPRSDEDIEGSFDNDVLIGDAARQRAARPARRRQLLRPRRQRRDRRRRRGQGLVHPVRRQRPPGRDRDRRHDRPGSRRTAPRSAKAPRSPASTSSGSDVRTSRRGAPSGRT